jgi:hypothetical protein
VVVDAKRAQKALRAEVERVTQLLRSVPDPEAAALGQWTVAEVAMHLSQAWIAVPALARRDLSEIHAVLPELKGTAGASVIRDVWDLGGVTRMGVTADPERDLAVLAGRIADRASAYLAGLSGFSPHESRAWLVEGTEVTIVTLTCHLLNETIVHGWDMARGAGRLWPIRPAHAALAVDGFLVPVFKALGPRAMVDQEQAAGLHATYEVRVRGGGRHVFVFDDGELTIEDPSRRPIDCYIDADPVAFLMVAWGREGLGPATVRRELVVSGPKAWLGPKFRSLMRNP